MFLDTQTMGTLVNYTCESCIQLAAVVRILLIATCIALLKVGTHWATSYSNESRRKITPCVQVRRLVAATSNGDASQRQIALCVQENFGENLCLCNRVFSQQQVAQILSDLIFCDLLQRQNYVAETKIFTKILQHSPSDLSLRRVAATCCCNLSPSVYRPLTLISCLP